MGRLKRIAIIAGFMLVFLIGIVGVIWYQRTTHFDNDFTSQIKRTLHKENDMFLYKSDLGKIKNLTITNQKQLTYLKEFPNLQELMIDNSNISIEELNANLQNIEKLVLSQCKIIGQGQECNLNHLKNVKIYGVHIEDSTFLKGLKGLEVLEYDAYEHADPTDHDDIDLSFMQNYKELKTLRFDNHKFKNISVINELPKLEEVLITGESLEEKVQWKQNMQIKWMNVKNINQKSFDNIIGLASIKDLILSFSDTPVLDIHQIDQLSNLQKLHIRAKKPENDSLDQEKYNKARLKGWESIYNLKFLKDVKAYDCNVDFKFPKP